MFKSVDAGKTWQRVGLVETRQIGKIVVDPRDASRVYVAVLGNVDTPNADRGVFRSLDGGKTWKNSGGVAVSTWSRMGTLSLSNWEPACLAGESNTVVPDPKDGNLLYGSGDQRCDQARNLLSPTGGHLPGPDPSNPNRKTWTLPQIFSLTDEACITQISLSCARAIADAPGQIHQQLAGLAPTVDSADSDPTPTMVATFRDYCKQLDSVTMRWNDLLKARLSGLNQHLEAEKLSALPAANMNATSCR